MPTPEEQRILRYGKAILKLKHFRRNLKYAIWDYQVGYTVQYYKSITFISMINTILKLFQDGKSIAESCQKNKITEQGLRYTLDLITSRTGETLDQFRDNKSSNCDELPGPRTDEYTANLRQAVFAFKQKRFGSLFEYASQNQVREANKSNCLISYVMFSICCPGELV